MGKIRILVLTANAGFGHRSACKALVAAIEREHGEDCEVVASNPLDSPLTPSWLREIQADYDHIATELPKLYKLGYDLSDTAAVGKFVENALRVLLFRSLRKTIRDARPDVIISTYPLYQAPLGTVFAMEGRAIPLVCVVTDLATIHSIWFSSDADLTIVPTPLVRDLGLAAGLESARLEVIGIPVNPRFSSGTGDKAGLRARLGWEPDRIALLAVGSKRVSGLPECLDVLNHSGLPIQLAVAAGGDDALFARLKAMTWHLPVKLYNFVEELSEMIQASDMIVSKAGGLIVTESLAAGRPILLVAALPGQEAGNADYILRGGAGEMATEPVQCLKTVFHWLADDGRILKERSEAARGLGRPRAASDIVERALALAKAPRGAAPRQLRDRLVELFKRFGESWED
jgi:1,2-diacylglycerol 3-beta-galactosyltransferase